MPMTRPPSAARCPEFPRGPGDLERLADGDREAFDAFFACWFPKVLGWSHKHLSSNADARALAESCLERALSQVHLRPEAVEFGRWMLMLLYYEFEARERGSGGWAPAVAGGAAAELPPAVPVEGSRP